MVAGEIAIRGELIGTKVQVVGTGIKGRIIDETKNMFLIKTHNTKKKVIKKNHNFILSFPQYKVKINGNLIALRPEDRIKMRLPKKWKVEILD